MEYITIGRILTTWGIEGKLKVKPETDFPQRCARGARVYISETLAGEPVGIAETDGGLWTVMFGPVLLGTLDAAGVFRKPARRKRTKQGCGFVDNANALPTSPQPQQQQ